MLLFVRLADWSTAPVVEVKPVSALATEPGALLSSVAFVRNAEFVSETSVSARPFEVARFELVRKLPDSVEIPVRPCRVCAFNVVPAPRTEAF